jgi:hypothetical protein
MDKEKTIIKNDLKIVFMGTPVFSVPVLEGLINNYQVVAVVTQPDRCVGRKKQLVSSPIKQVANKNHILDLFDKYYKFDDENIYEIVSECDLNNVKKTKDDRDIIENMDRIMKKTLHLKADITKLGD